MVVKADLLVVIGTILFLVGMGHVQNTHSYWLTIALIGMGALFMGIVLSVKG